MLISQRLAERSAAALAPLTSNRSKTSGVFKYFIMLKMSYPGVTKTEDKSHVGH